MFTLGRWYKTVKQCRAYKTHAWKFIEENSCPKAKNVNSSGPIEALCLHSQVCLVYWTSSEGFNEDSENIRYSGNIPALFLSLQFRLPSQKIRCSIEMLSP